MQEHPCTFVMNRQSAEYGRTQQDLKGDSVM